MDWKPSLATGKAPCLLRSTQLCLQTLSQQTQVPESLWDGLLTASQVWDQECFNAVWQVMEEAIISKTRHSF